MRCKTSTQKAMSLHSILQFIRARVPVMSNSVHKGQHGKLCIIGGSKLYTGAPYFAGMSALRCGVDLVTIVCEKNAAIPIKCYAPDLMVNPLLPSTCSNPPLLSSSIPEILRYDCIVIGCGLGRDEITLKYIVKVVEALKASNKPIVLDGDALWLLYKEPQLITGYKHAILTANAMEFRRLWSSLSTKPPPDFDISQHDIENTPKDQWHTHILANEMGGVTIVRKGIVDVISNGNETMVCVTESCPRRCGGLGDILAGIMGAFYTWSYDNHDVNNTVHTALCACHITRQAMNTTYTSETGRGMLASDVLLNIPYTISNSLTTPAPDNKE